MAPKPQLAAQLTFLVGGIGLLTLGLLVAFGYWGMSSVDDIARNRERRFVTRWVGEQTIQLAREQESITVWDDAVIKAQENDQTWLDENLGSWMATYFGHDGAYVLRPDGSPLYAMENAAPVASGKYGKVKAYVDPLVKRLRSEMAESSAGTTDSTATVSSLFVSDIVSLQAGLAIVSVRPIVPSSSRVSQPPRLGVSTRRCTAA